MKVPTPWGEIQVEKRGKRLFVFSHKNKALTEEIKAWKGCRWEPEERCRSVTDCRRNWLQIESLQGRVPEEFAPYYADLMEVEAQRPLYQYQKRMLSFMLTRRRCIVAAEQGVGKSLATIEALNQIGGRWLWVAPSKVLKAIELELEKWDNQADVDLMSYAALRSVQGRGLKYDGIVFDESSRLKNGGTQQYKGARHLAKKAEWVFLLSGKPAPNSPRDWWAQAELCCPGWLRESNAAKLEQRCAIIVMQGEWPKIIGWHEDEIEKLGRRLSRLAMVIKSEDVQELPPIRFHRVRLPVSELTKATARVIANQAIQPLAALRQVSDGFRYMDSGDVVRVEGPKDQALREILWRYEESGRIIVFAGFRESVRRCAEICNEEGWLVLRCDGAGFKPPAGYDVKTMLREMDRSQEHRLEKVAFVANPMSGGMGLTLTASRAAVFFSQDFNAESRTQALKRGHREGMGDTFDVYDLLHLGTDELILDRLESKLAVGEVTLDQIMEVLT